MLYMCAHVTNDPHCFAVIVHLIIMGPGFLKQAPIKTALQTTLMPIEAAASWM